MTADVGRKGSVDRLLAVMARLRDPESGCPWDRAQRYATIAPYTIEEAYEVADAIAREDFDALKDELGDLLFQVVFYARMAEEDGLFDFAAVAAAIADKMVRRHPHVFGAGGGPPPEALHRAWEAHKAEERAEAASVDGRAVSALDGVARALPALLRAEKLQKRASRVGFDWPELAPVADKIREELGELEHEIAQGGDADRLEDEVGDLLFAVVNFARHLKTDPEAALRQANDKFERRFRGVEQRLRAEGRSTAEASLDEMDALWNSLKAEERGKDGT